MMTCRVRFSLVVTLAALTAFAGNSVAEEEQAPKPGAEFAGLKFRSIGPAAGGRVSRSAGVPGNPLIYYAATSAGGVWKSTDDGLNWFSIFDDQPDSSIGSIALAPSDPSVIYVGAGEANIRGNVAVGHGIYKSVDSGKTWKQVWKQEGQIGTMAVHPNNPDIAFAAVLGHAFGPNPERGIYRTTDGGKTWQQVLAKDRDTGASDVCIDPSNPRVVFAGLWQARRRPWEMTSGGPGSGLYVSRDGGDTWKQLTGKGLPEGPWGKIGVAVAPSDGRRVYALIEAEKGGLFRSDDGGDNWRLMSPDRHIRQRSWYYTTITVHPQNPDIVYCPNVGLMKSVDGGKTFQAVHQLHHGDTHDLWIDPKDPLRMICSNDGGVDVTSNGGEAWYGPPLAISQFYHIAVDNENPYHVSGCMQDLGSADGPSNSLRFNGITSADWTNVGGGEAGYTAPDPVDSNIIYAGEYGGYISRYDRRTGQTVNVSIYPFATVGHGAEELKYRFQWTAPILVSPHAHNTVYHGANILFRTTDAGMHWEAISPDLTRNDKSKQRWSGGPITGDNTSVEYYDTIFAIAESPRQKDLLWVGTDDGLVQLSQDGGKNWSNVTPNIPGMPEWAAVTCIEPSPYDSQTAYVVVDAHKLDDMKPYLFRTTDLGRTWQSLSAKLPQDANLHAVREDPQHKGLLFVGSERGVWYSPDDGATWHHLKLNLPTAAVHDLAVKGNDLIVGTMGRSIWILDDITPIRDMTSALRNEEAHLFPIQPATRWHYRASFAPAQGASPPVGAVIYYHLKQKPKGDVTIEIRDGQGTLIRKLSSKPEKRDRTDMEEFLEGIGIRGGGTLPNEAGTNKATWDLRYEGAKPIKKAQAWGFVGIGPFVLPGTYTATLMVDGKKQSSDIKVLMDPRVQVPTAQLAEQLKFSLAIRDTVNKLSQMVQQIRDIRTQLNARKELLKDNSKASALLKLSDEIVGKLDTLESKLQNPKAEVTYDLLAQKGGAKLYSVLAYLFGASMEGDGAPTQGQRDVYDASLREFQGYEAEFHDLVQGDLARLQEMARDLTIPYVIIPDASSEAKKPEATQSPDD